VLEVFTRRNIAALIDHGDEYVERATDLSRHVKLDLALVRGIHGRTITIGDIVAYSVPLSSFGQIISYFNTLLGRPIRPLLEDARDRWATEIGQKIAADVRPLVDGALDEWSNEMEAMAAGPIIRDFDALAAALSRLFEIRHILCHELTSRPIYDVSEIQGFLDAAFRFTRAVEEVLTLERFGVVPLTQAEMNTRADERVRSAEAELNDVVSRVQARLGADADWRHTLQDAQDRWLSYRDAQCEFHAYSCRGGTIRPMISAAEATRLTEVRAEELRSWLSQEALT
jgi:uncharacterized protein YecT (DUF1311 family)